MNRVSTIQRVEDRHLEKYNGIFLRDPRLIATLPFDQNGISRYVTDAILHQTRERWTWFAKAREMNSSLGTLCYLPLELRHLIWQAVLHCRDTLSADGLWEYECGLGPVFDPSSYYFGFGRRTFKHNGIENLRLVSPSVQREYDETFLARPFRFNDATNLTAFLNRLREPYLSQLTSLEIGICTMYNVERWIAPLERLPKGLRRIRFRIYTTIPGWYEGQSGEQSLQTLVKLVRITSQSAPNAKTTMSSVNENPLPRQCQILFDELI